MRNSSHNQRVSGTRLEAATTVRKFQLCTVEFRNWIRSFTSRPKTSCALFGCLTNKVRHFSCHFRNITEYSQLTNLGSLKLLLSIISQALRPKAVIRHSSCRSVLSYTQNMQYASKLKESLTQTITHLFVLLVIIKRSTLSSHFT